MNQLVAGRPVAAIGAFQAIICGRREGVEVFSKDQHVFSIADVAANIFGVKDDSMTADRGELSISRRVGHGWQGCRSGGRIGSGGLIDR